jgi:hypothetical protein
MQNELCNTYGPNYYMNEFMFMKYAYIENEFLAKKIMTLMNLTTWMIISHV